MIKRCFQTVNLLRFLKQDYHARFEIELFLTIIQGVLSSIRLLMTTRPKSNYRYIGEIYGPWN